MKILVISNLYPPNVFGGAEVLTEALVSALRRKHAVQVLTSTSKHVYEEGVHPVFRMWMPYPYPIKISVWYTLKSFYTSLFNYFKTFAWILRIKPDLIFVSDLKRISYAPLIVAQKLCPTVVFLHDRYSFDCMESGRSFKKKLKRIYGWMIFYRPVCVDYAISNSKHTLQMQNPQAVFKYAQVVGVGIKPPSDLDEIIKAHPKGLKKGPVLLFLGRIERGKGVHDIVKACHILVQNHELKNLKLQIVGFENDPHYRRELEELIQQCKLEERVHFVGKVSEREKYQRLQKADLFVFASTWEEGHGQTYLEAMICGTPCICALSGGAREVLKDGENCLTFEGGKPESLAKAALQMLQNDPQREEIVSKARQMVLEQYTQDPFVARCEAAFEDCVSQWRSSRSISQASK